jgi:hypothetical protein
LGDHSHEGCDGCHFILCEMRFCKIEERVPWRTELSRVERCVDELNVVLRGCRGNLHDRRQRVYMESAVNRRSVPTLRREC